MQGNRNAAWQSSDGQAEGWSRGDNSWTAECKTGREIQFMDRSKPQLLTLSHITTTWDACAGTSNIFYIPGMMHGPGNHPNKLTMYMEDTAMLNCPHCHRIMQVLEMCRLKAKKYKYVTVKVSTLQLAGGERLKLTWHPPLNSRSLKKWTELSSCWYADLDSGAEFGVTQRIEGRSELLKEDAKQRFKKLKVNKALNSLVQI